MNVRHLGIVFTPLPKMSFPMQVDGLMGANPQDNDDQQGSEDENDYNTQAQTGESSTPKPDEKPPMQGTTYSEQEAYNNRLAILLAINKAALGLSESDHTLHKFFEKKVWNPETLDQTKVLVSYLHQALIAWKNPYPEGSSTDLITNLVLPVGAADLVDAKKVFFSALAQGHTVSSSGPGTISLTCTLKDGKTIIRSIGEGCQIPHPAAQPLKVKVSDKKTIPKLAPLGNAHLSAALVKYHAAKVGNVPECDLGHEFKSLQTILSGAPKIDVSYVNLPSFLKFFSSVFPKETTPFGQIHPHFIATLSSAVTMMIDPTQGESKRMTPLPLTPKNLAALLQKLAARGAEGYTLYPLLEGPCSLSAVAQKKYDELIVQFSLAQPDPKFAVLLKSCLLTIQYKYLYQVAENFPFVHLLTFATQLSRVISFQVLKPQPVVIYTFINWDPAWGPANPVSVTTYYNRQATNIATEMLNTLHEWKKVSFTMDANSKARDLSSIDITTLWKHPEPAPTAGSGVASLFDLSSLEGDLEEDDKAGTTTTSHKRKNV